MSSGRPRTSHRQIPGLFQVFPTEALIFIKPSDVYRQAYVNSLSEYYGTIGSPSCACQLYLTVLRYVYFVTITTMVAPNKETNEKFPDFSRFSCEPREITALRLLTYEILYTETFLHNPHINHLPLTPGIHRKQFARTTDIRS